MGWDTYKKTIQSYHNGTCTPTKNYAPDESKGQTNRHAKAREFFDRIAYFHDQARDHAKNDRKVFANIPPASRNVTGAQVLRSLSDDGKLLDQHFTVKTSPLDNVQSESAMVVAAPPPIQKSASAIPSQEEIRTLQAEIKILQDKLDSPPQTRASEPEMIRLYNDIAPLQNRLNVLTK